MRINVFTVHVCLTSPVHILYLQDGEHFLTKAEHMHVILQGIEDMINYWWTCFLLQLMSFDV